MLRTSSQLTYLKNKTLQTNKVRKLRKIVHYVTFLSILFLNYTCELASQKKCTEIIIDDLNTVNLDHLEEVYILYWYA